MTEETFVQLFWMIGIVTIICLALVIGGAIHYLLVDPDMRHLRKLEAARAAWAKILSEGKTDGRDDSASTTDRRT